MSDEKELNKKYEFTDETIEVDGHVLHRIKALRYIEAENVYAYKGDLGGFIESEDNLDIYDDSWVANNAMVYDGAYVCEAASIEEHASVHGHVIIRGKSYIGDNAYITSGDNRYAEIIIDGDIQITDSAHIEGDLELYGIAEICRNAKIASLDDILVISGIGSENRTTTFFKCEDTTIKVKCGCFCGTLDEFEEQVIAHHGDNRFAQEYLHMIEIVKAHFGILYKVVPLKRYGYSIYEKLQMIKNIIKM